MIRVQLFASLKDAAGTSEVEVLASPPITVEEIYQLLLAEYPALQQYRSIVLKAVNEEYATWDTRVKAEDEVAFFPPVSGGAL